MTSGVPYEIYVAAADFRRELRRLRRFSREVSAAAGLKPQHFQAMLSVRASPDRRMSIKELADDLVLKRHFVSELVDELEALGLASRASDQNDGRVVVVSLTERAEDLLAPVAAAHLAELRRIREPLTCILESL
jgi:DNA-binding MarR family transcriptional regulator